MCPQFTCSVWGKYFIKAYHPVNEYNSFVVQGCSLFATFVGACIDFDYRQMIQSLIDCFSPYSGTISGDGDDAWVVVSCAYAKQGSYACACVTDDTECKYFQGSLIAHSCDNMFTRFPQQLTAAVTIDFMCVGAMIVLMICVCISYFPNCCGNCIGRLFRHGVEVAEHIDPAEVAEMVKPARPMEGQQYLVDAPIPTAPPFSGSAGLGTRPYTGTVNPLSSLQPMSLLVDAPFDSNSAVSATSANLSMAPSPFGSIPATQYRPLIVDAALNKI